MTVEEALNAAADQMERDGKQLLLYRDLVEVKDQMIATQQKSIAKLKESNALLRETIDIYQRIVESLDIPMQTVN